MSVDAGMMLVAAGVAACTGLFLISRSKRPSGDTREWGKLSPLVNKTEHAVILAAPDGTIQWINNGFTRITGFDISEASGKLIGAVLLGSLHSPKALLQIKNGLTARKAFGLELLCAHKDGHRYWLSLHLAPVLNETEQVVNF